MNVPSLISRCTVLSGGHTRLASTAIRWLCAVWMLAISALPGCGSTSTSIQPATPMTAPTYPPDVSEQILQGQLCPDVLQPIKSPIVFSENENLIAISPQGSQQTQLTAMPSNTRAFGVAWSPDGQTLAYVLGYMLPDPDIPWLQVGMICGIDRQTGKGRLLARGATATESFEEVAWAPDGKSLVLTRYQNIFDEKKQLVHVDIALVRYDLASGVATALVRDGIGPALSADGRHMAFIQVDRERMNIGRTLMIAEADGSNARPLLDPQAGFTFVGEPRWSPDSQILAFPASGGPVGMRIPPVAARSLLERVFGGGIAEAHGDPEEIWIVGADGQGLQRLTADKLDDPRMAWSPDGKSLIFTSTLGSVTLLDLASKTKQAFTQEGLFGAIDWAWK